MMLVWCTASFSHDCTLLVGRWSKQDRLLAGCQLSKTPGYVLQTGHNVRQGGQIWQVMQQQTQEDTAGNTGAGCMRDTYSPKKQA